MSWQRWEHTVNTTGHALEAFQGLLQDAADDLLLHSTGPGVMHNVGGAAFAHQTEGDVQLVSVHPGPTDTQDVGVLGKGHQRGLSLEETEGMERKRIEVEDLECTGDRGRTPSVGSWGRWVVEGRVDDGRGAVPDGCAERVVCRIVAEGHHCREWNAM